MAAGDDFAALSRRLTDAGETGLRRALYQAIDKAAQPLKTEIRAGLKPRMPNRYAETLDADLKLSVSRLAGSNPGVRLIATAAPHAEGSSRERRNLTGRKLRRLDGGLLTHPLWGNREHWYTQPVTPGFFTGPCKASAPRARREILAAMHDTAVKIMKG